MEYSIITPSRRSGSQTPNNWNPESANSSIIGVLLLIAITMITGSIVLLIVNSQPIPEKVPMAYLGISKSNDGIELINKAGDTLTRSSIIILVDGIDRTAEFRTQENTPSWVTLKAGERLHYTSPIKSESIQIVYASNSRQYLLASSGSTTNATIEIVPTSTIPSQPIEVVGTATVDAQILSTTIPTTMSPGQSYPVSVTVKNTGSMTWDEADMIRLGGIGDASGVADKFGASRFFILKGTNVLPEAQYTFTFTMTAPATPGTYSPQYKMVWDEHQWFGALAPQTIQVVNPANVPHAQFTSNVTQGTSPLFVQFTDQSTGTAPLTYHWDFSDGDHNLQENSQKNPVWHFWEEYGTSYTVTLTVTNAYGSDSIVKQNYITLGTTPSAAPVAAFTSSVQSGTAPLTVQFTDQSTGSTPRSYAWDFNNDRSVDSTVKSPAFTYVAPGNYTVNLTVISAEGKDTEIKSSYIRVTSQGSNTLPTAQFTASPLQGQAPLNVQFTDTSFSTGTTSYQWDMNNDGVTDYTIKNPVHTYQAAGTYTVKLTVTNASGSDSEIKTKYITLSSLQSGECYGAEACNPTGNSIGGGTGYPTYTSATSTYTVTTLAEFKSRMVGGSAPATAGQVVFIPSGTTIDLTGQNSITIPAGVTIASDRGYNGAKGATIKKYTGSGYSMLTVGGSNVRVTGLVLEGPNPAPETLNYLVMGILNMNGYTGLVVDNNEIWGWSYAGVFSNGAPTTGRPNIHHNYIHHNQGDGYGYGVNVNGGDALVEANIFDYNRHSITGGGLVGERYEFRYNIHLGHGSVVGGTHVDVHENEHYSSDRVACAGTEYRIHHNTVNQGSGTAQQAFVHIRDVPQTGAYIYNNLINTNWGSSSNNDGAQSVIYQSCDYSNHYGGVYATNNMWKGTLYTTNTGIVWEQKHA